MSTFSPKSASAVGLAAPLLILFPLSEPEPESASLSMMRLTFLGLKE